MGEKWRIFTAGLAVVLLAVLGWAWSQPKQPVYEGKTIGYWLHNGMELVNDGDFHFGGTRIGNVIVFGAPTLDSNALPYLVKALKTRDGPLHAIATWSWNKLPVRFQDRFQKPLPASVVRLRAAGLLGNLKAEAVSAIPELIRALKNDDNAMVRLTAIDSLVQIDGQNPAVKKALTEATTDKDRAVRAEAILQLTGPYNGTPDPL